MLLMRSLNIFSNVNSSFSSFYINSFIAQSKLRIYTRAAFCTDALRNTNSETKSIQENNYYIDYLKSEPESYPNFAYVFELHKEIENTSESFKLITELPLNVENREKHLQNIATELSACDIDEICKRIIFISKHFPRKSEKAYGLELIKCIDNELWNRLPSFKEILNILLVVKRSNYSFRYKRKGIFYLLRKINQLSPQEIVQLFFSIKSMRFSKFDYKYSLYSYLNDNISQFNSDEMGIISKGIVQGKLTFNHKSIGNTILNKMFEDIENIHPVPLGDICKVLIKMDNSINEKQILDFQEKVIPHVLNYDLTDLLNLSDLGVNNGFMNSSLWDVVARKFKESSSTLSSSALSRIVRQMVMCNIQDEELLTLAVQEFEKYKGMEKKNDLVDFLFHLSLSKLYPKNLLDVVLSEQFATESITRRVCKISRLMVFQWWTLYCNLEMEKPEYLNYTLKHKERSKLFHFCQGILKDFHFNFSYEMCYSFTLHMRRNLKSLYGVNAVIKYAALPQFGEGLVMKFNKDFEAQPIPNDFFDNSRAGYVTKPPDDDYWIYINVIPGKQHQKDMATAFGYYPTKFRQLTAVGYIPVMVTQYLYFMHKKERSQDKFITDLIQKTLRDNIK